MAFHFFVEVHPIFNEVKDNASGKQNKIKSMAFHFFVEVQPVSTEMSIVKLHKQPIKHTEYMTLLSRTKNFASKILNKEPL